MTRIAVLLLGAAVALSAQSVFNMRRAPGFSLPDTKMRQVDLQDLRGKVVLIDFMRTDCPHCLELSRNLEQVKAKYGDKVVVLSVVTAGADNMNTVTRYINTNKVTSTFLFDCGQMTASYLNITPANPQIELPHLVVVDKVGMIRRELKPDGVSMPNILGVLEAALK